MGTLETLPAGVARCTTHGGEYKILFWREEPPPLLPANPTVPVAGVFCQTHSNLRAAFICRRCNASICDVCAFPQDDGSRLCPTCATLQSAEPVSRGGIPAVALAVQGKYCPQHPAVAAVQICNLCGAPMCATCDFLVPGNLHVCPTCATTPQTALSPKRKKMLIGSFALALWCTVVLGALMSGMFQGMVKTKADEQLFGYVLFIILLGPSIAGLSLGLSSMDRRMSNKIPMWIATIWNGMILAGFVLLVIVGLMKG